MALSYARAFAQRESATLSEAFDLACEMPRVFDAAFVEAEGETGDRKVGESARSYADRIKAEREALANGG